MNATMRIVLDYRDFQHDIHGMQDDVENEGRRAALLAAAIFTQSRWKEAIAQFPMHGRHPHVGLVDTGSYLRSIMYEFVGTSVIIGTDISDPPYPMFLEFGTSRMPAYPHVRPMLDANEGKIIGEIATVLKTFLGRYSR